MHVQFAHNFDFRAQAIFVSLWSYANNKNLRVSLVLPLQEIPLDLGQCIGYNAGERILVMVDSQRMFGLPVVVSKIKESYSSGEWGLTINMPGIVQGFHANRIGVLFAAETRDVIVSLWKRGLMVSGRAPRHDIDFIKKRREIDLDVLAYVRGEKTLKKKDQTLWRSKMKYNQKMYSRTEIRPTEINGINTSYRQRIKYNYLPEPNNPTINNSGLMIDSLNVRYMRGRKSKLGGVSKIAWIRMRVAKSRDKSGTYAGFQQKYVRHFYNMLVTNRDKYHYTLIAMEKAYSWAEARKIRQYKNDIRRVENVLKQITRGLSALSIR